MDKYPKRLIEVDLPIKRISINARAEKDSRCGHIPRLHIYPAARPVAACRAIICAAAWFDPVDKNCPSLFIREATKEMKKWSSFEYQQLLSINSQPFFEQGRKNEAYFDQKNILREALLNFITEFSDFKNSTLKEFLFSANALTKAAGESIEGEGYKLVLADPFAGGGAIPLEGLRIGASSIASDTNPIAVLINRVVLQYSPKYGGKLADEVLSWGKKVNSEAIPYMSKFYPIRADATTPIAYLWARTIISEAPDGESTPVEVPLIRSMWLSRKGKKVALRWKRNSKGKVETIIEQIKYSNGQSIKVRKPILEIFSPKSSDEVTKGTVARNAATCPISGYTTPASRVQEQLKKRFGGASDSRMFCVVSTKPGVDGRVYSSPSNDDYLAYESALIELKKLQSELKVPSIIPNEPIPPMSGVFNAPLYGHLTWGSLFNARQLLALITYVKLARQHIEKVIIKDKDFGLAVAAVLGLVIDRLADLNASLCVWQLSTPNTAHVFGRWALPMIMDYGEVNPLAGAGGSPESAVWRIASAITDIGLAIRQGGEVFLCSAEKHPMPNDSVDLFITDPPYYNAVPYADISDFFYVWLKRTIGDKFPELFSTELTLKDAEICEMAGWDSRRYAHKDKNFFETKMAEAATRAREYLKPSGIGIVVFAHKTTAGWEAILQALINAGWIITASWPIDTEMASRLRAKGSAVLASSVHLICRPRENSDGKILSDQIGDWRDVLQELPRRIHEWMPRLAREGVVGADAIFSCLGPALEIFSRYSRVEKASGDVVSLKEYLEQVWAAVAKEALSLLFAGADASGLEPDARITAMWLWTLNAGNNETSDDENDDNDANEEADGSSAKTKTSGFILEYDTARKIAQGLGGDLDKMENFVEVKGDIARLIPVEERARYLFGAEGNESVPMGSKKKIKNDKQGDFWAGLMASDSQSEKIDLNIKEKISTKPGATALDKVHQSMILFAAGRSDALKRFLVEDGVGRDQKFWHLAQSLSALYPTQTEEKRWVDGVLARKKGLGF